MFIDLSFIKSISTMLLCTRNNANLISHKNLANHVKIINNSKILYLRHLRTMYG